MVDLVKDKNVLAFEKLLHSFLAESLTGLLEEMDKFHRGRVEAKAFSEPALLIILKQLLDPKILKTRITAFLTGSVEKGYESTEKDLDMNITRRPEFLQIVERTSFERVKEMTDDLAAELKKTMVEGWNAGEGIAELKERVKEVYGDGNLTDGRATAIARTESSNAFNGAKLQAARDSGVAARKRWKEFVSDSGVPLDNRVGKDSIKLHGQTRELDELFFDSVNGKFIDRPPNRPNDRATLQIIPVV